MSGESLDGDLQMGLLGDILAELRRIAEDVRWFRDREENRDRARQSGNWNITPEAEKKHRVLVPEGISHVDLRDGSTILVPPDRIIEVSEEDAISCGQRGWPDAAESDDNPLA